MATATLTQMQQKQQTTDVANMRPKDQIAHFLDQKKGEIAKMLPKHLNAERLLKVAQIAATTTPALLECDVPSLVGAIGQCAQMGLEPNTVLGHAYLVPFNVKRKGPQGERWVKSVQVVIGYKGLIDLARRSGQIVSIAAHEVCANDKFELVYGIDEKLNHTPALGERGEILGFYAVAKLKDGGHCCEFMSVHQVQEIMRATQSKGAYGPWKDHFAEMGRKTVIRRLSKYLPLSIEFQTAAALDGMADAGKDQKLDTLDGDFSFLPEDAPLIENEAVDQSTGEVIGEKAGETGTPEISFAKVADSLQKATDLDVLDVAADLIGAVADKDQQDELRTMYAKRKEELSAPPAAARTRAPRGNPTIE
jgi:recombination protein RecT